MSDSENESEMSKSGLYNQTPEITKTKSRPSKRIEDKKPKKSNDFAKKSAPISSSQSGKVHTYKDLKKIIADCFEFDIRGTDIKFIEELYSSIPSLFEIWERIGFNKDTVDKRLGNFYENLKVTLIN